MHLHLSKKYKNMFLLLTNLINNNMIDIIVCMAQIDCLKKKIEECEKEKKKLLTPVLSNLDYLPLIYSWCQEYSCIGQEKMSQSDIDSRRRNLFLFIVRLLYSPSSFLGIRVKNGIRKKVAELLGISSSSAISDYFKNSSNEFMHYQQFKNDLHILYNLIYECLVERGIILS